MSTESASGQPSPSTLPPEKALPFSARRAADVPGHWLLARMGKTVLRPGGRALTEEMVAALSIEGSDVVELAPGIGLTARLLLNRQPASYVGIEENPSAAEITNGVVGEHGRVVTGNAKATGLPDACADVAVGEAMLTMQTDHAKGEILAEVFRVLRPGGQFAFHELSLVPDDISAATATEIRRSLAQSIKVNARPLTISEWRALLAEHGFEVQRVQTADMALLRVRRVLADEGVVGTLKIGRNYLRDSDARHRVNGMWKTFHQYRKSIGAVSVVATKPVIGGGDSVVDSDSW